MIYLTSDSLMFCMCWIFIYTSQQRTRPNHPFGPKKSTVGAFPERAILRIEHEKNYFPQRPCNN